MVPPSICVICRFSAHLSGEYGHCSSCGRDARTTTIASGTGTGTGTGTGMEPTRVV